MLTASCHDSNTIYKQKLRCYITLTLVTQTISTIIQGNNITKFLYVKL